jgi:hypothetical protein
MYARGMAVGTTVGAASTAAVAATHYYYHPPVVVAPAAPVYVAPRPAAPEVNVTVTSPATVTGGQAAAVARLKEIKSLLNQGLISQSQYQEESQKLLNQIVE